MSKNNKRPFEEKLPLILSFVIPILVMLVVCAGKGVWPFGDKCFLRTDLYHQYAPFVSELGDRLKLGSSMLYDWGIGLGSNYTSLFAYYLSSPLNLLMFIIPDAFVIEFITIGVFLKLGLCGLTMALYLSHKKETRSMSIAVFAICYALCGYMAAYNWNIMWLDCLWLAPLIILGLEKLVKDNKPFLYCVTLALAIITNYYISIMICIYMVLYFIALIIMLPKQRFTEYLKKIGLFALYSLIAGALAAVLLIPAYYSLLTTASGNFSFPTAISSYFSVFEMLGRQLMLVECEEGLEHWPNIYCGVIIFLCLPMYYMNKRVPAKEKIVKTVLAIFMLLCFALNIPNYIWHGMHYPNSLPCRQSFLFTILILSMCFEGYRGIRGMTKGKVAGCFWGAAAFIILAEQLIDAPEFQWYTYVVSLIFVGLYALAMYLYRSGKIRKMVCYAMILAVLVLELGINTAVTSVPITSRTSYMENKKIYERLYAEATQDDLFARAERTRLRTNNDGTWFGYNSASIFSSTTHAGVSQLYKKWGCKGSTNAYAVTGATPFILSLLNIRYTFSNEELPSSPLYTQIANEGTVYMYENTYTLPLGFVVPSDIDDLWNYTSVNPAKAQNALANLLDEANGDILHAIPGTENGKEYTSTSTQNARIFAYIENMSIDKVTARFGTETKNFTDVKNHYLLDLGYVPAGADISLRTDEDNQNMKATIYEFDDDAFMTLYDHLAANSLELTDFTDKWFSTSLSGTVTSSVDGELLLSIPYENGWKIYVDGVLTQGHEFSKALMMIPITAGSHTITMNYIPEGLLIGAVVSLAALVLLLICLFVAIIARSIKKSGRQEDSIEGMFDIPGLDPDDPAPAAAQEEVDLDMLLAHDPASDNAASAETPAPEVEINEDVTGDVTTEDKHDDPAPGTQTDNITGSDIEPIQEAADEEVRRIEFEPMSSSDKGTAYETLEGILSDLEDHGNK